MINIKKIFDKITSTRASGMYILLFAISIGAATFIENDFGTSAAQKVVFKTRWFELLLVLFAISILTNIFRFKMIQQKKWALMMFHMAILVILMGAGVTRYFGFEGHMHIREGSQTNEILSSEPSVLLKIKTQNGKSYSIAEPVLFASLGKNKFDRTYQVGKNVIQVHLNKFLPNPAESMVTDEKGLAILKVVISGEQGREEYYIHEGEVRNLHGVYFNFGNTTLSEGINMLYRNDSLLFSSNKPFSQFQMAINKTDQMTPGKLNTLLVRALYTSEDIKFVIGDFKPKARLETKSASLKMTNESIVALDFSLQVNGQQGNLTAVGRKGEEGNLQHLTLDGVEMGIGYGSKLIQLPFYLKLHDFILDRYPGTNSPSSYASEVTLVDPRTQLNQDYRIFMNHILDHDGYRFFQSSFDQDELGTVLSVNYDAPGTWISYIGYFFLTLGMLLTLITKKSRFSTIAERLKNSKPALKVKPAMMTMLLSFIFISNALYGNVTTFDFKVIDRDHANQFGHLLVQDQNGRIKPMNTLSGELIRKLARKTELYNQSPDQIIIGMMAFPETWANIPMIKVANQAEIKKLLSITTEMASYNDFFRPEYILQDAVMKAYNREPRDRTVYDKELIRLDERVNICNLIYTGRVMKWFPIKGDLSNTWSPPVPPSHASNELASGTPWEELYYTPYLTSIIKATSTNNWMVANKTLQVISNYQTQNGGNVLISDRKSSLEIVLNKLNVFSRVGMWYGLLGLVILVLFFISVFNTTWNTKWFKQFAFGSMAICFLFHTTGLALRWYVSGRAPWSNGYESMIYIAFTTVLSGLIFSRKSLGGLAATAILASTILMVAGLSWMDPEITPLVPVLKSYWLTIHVSMEAGSYGFLTLGALIGVLNLVLMIFTTTKNKEQVMRSINELSLTSEITLIAGVFIISIGTYLGGVWANESWGRYWGWDAKETWALVTILVYAFILHMRFIPGLRGVYAFNVASLFGFASVLMTYFGVNYYLSGLHSYAAGDPVPIPSFVYYTFFSLVTISILAFIRYKRVIKAS
ncbi:MAG: cytochrome c biogenesis protein CcsA [Saprospiraceae bacterium]